MAKRIMRGQVCLSQCMIVKNEEKNIEQALSWAKGIAWEQIVVDTGSTDRTVEIAEQMGAKVFHFSWIDDFSAAKNFAIEQASGNWIAFLDADEYFSYQDAEKLMNILIDIERKDSKIQKPDFIRSLLVNLDDEKRPTSSSVQDRIFRNLPSLRYYNRVHEELGLSVKRKIRPFDARNILTIFHTGYSDSAYQEKDKMKRNIALLQRELEANPDNYNALSYLGDCYSALGEYEKAFKLYQTVAEKDDEKKNILSFTLENSYGQILRLLVGYLDADAEQIKIWYEKASNRVPEQPDIEYWYGGWMANHNQWEETLIHFESALKKLEAYKGTKTLEISGELEQVYRLMARAAQELQEDAKTVQYGVLTLRFNRFQETVAIVLLSLLGQDPAEQKNPAGTAALLKKLYRLEHLRDKLFLLKCAKLAGFVALENWIYSLMTPEEKEGLL